ERDGMKKALLAVVAVVAAVTAVVLGRARAMRSRQPRVAPAAAEPLDTAALAQRLAGALRFRTISYQDSTRFDAREFAEFQRYLRAAFPRLHAALALERVNGYGLLYRWAGTDSTLAPVLLLAHQDVVPVEPGTEGRWTEPPFDGRVAGGYVWGRGALDDKGNLVAILEAVEHLVAAGAAPRRAHRRAARRARGAPGVRARRRRRAGHGARARPRRSRGARRHRREGVRD